ncbi:hypothetical protein GCM10009601_39520 [Streptomyces thermospinosisporus]|uniref:N-(5'-phosphoribosyl)anthranilate isomerase n=1 Tax=Streptomyces thermospinosisporus TaxID=161482 RepID=A0ABP4JUR6_9ACTN
MLVKFCGATTAGEVTGLAAAGADLVGLWYRVPGGRSELTAARLTALSETARGTGRLAPVLVTFSSDPGELLRAVRTARVPYVQLHGFQTPGTVRALRRHGPAGLTIIKALHLRGAACLEDRLTDAYERAGADWFLLDTAAADGRIGSTGEPLRDAAVRRLAERIRLPFLLAGGLHGGNSGDFTRTRAHPRFLGIDVDSAARGEDGLLCAGRAAAVADTWRST